VFAKKRPFCEQFLSELAPHFEIVMFTASMNRYAKPLFRKLDPKGNIIDFELFREHCEYVRKEFYVKDLTRLGRSMDSVIIVDNSPHAYMF
jgi:carboxy-terminal domain RNA polymerase II polypeptide A small phosphatase